MAAALMSEPLPPDYNKGPGLLAVGWIEAILGTLVLAARLYTRGVLRKALGWDDYTMVFAWALAIITTIFVTVGVHYGIGRHLQYVIQDPENAMQALKMTWLTAPFSTMSAAFGKLSIALLLMRLLDPNPWRSGFLWFISLSLIVVNIILIVITFEQCTPTSYLWTRLSPTAVGSCWSPLVQDHVGLFQGAYSAFTDFVLAVFPAFFILRLQMPLKTKIGLTAVLSLGLIATAAAIVKTVNLPELAEPDFTWTPDDLTYWYLTENWSIIISACIPTLKPLFDAGASKVNSYRTKNATKGGYGDNTGITPAGTRNTYESKGYSNLDRTKGRGTNGGDTWLDRDDEDVEMQQYLYSGTGHESKATALVGGTSTPTEEFGIRKTTEISVV